VAARAFVLRGDRRGWSSFLLLPLCTSSNRASTATNAAAMGYDVKHVHSNRSRSRRPRYAFVPSDAELASAARPIAAIGRLEKTFRAPVTVDGRMVGLCHIRYPVGLMSFRG